MPGIYVDVDLDEFEDDDILNEAERIIKRATQIAKHPMRKKVLQFMRDLQVPIASKNETKVDEWKDELWPQLKAKYSLEQLEALINQ